MVGGLACACLQTKFKNPEYPFQVRAHDLHILSTAMLSDHTQLYTVVVKLISNSC